MTLRYSKATDIPKGCKIRPGGKGLVTWDEMIPVPVKPKSDWEILPATWLAKTGKPKRGNPEHALQAAVIQWWALARHQWKLPAFALFAIPNGGARNVITGKLLKAEGVRPGIPDLMLAVVRSLPYACVIPGLYIEMKAGKGKPSPEQKEVIAYLRNQGYHCVIAYSVDEAIQAIQGYLGKP